MAAVDHPENANAGNLKAIHDVEKAKVGSSAMDPSMQMSMVSQTLAISSFPQAVQALLREAYDKDGNGHIATDELVESAKLAIKTRKCNSMLWKFLLLAIFLVLALIGVNAGLTYGIVDANKETKVEGRILMVRDDDGLAEVPVATSNNEVTVTIAAIPFLPPSAVSHTKHVGFSVDGQTHHKTVQSVVVTPEKSVRLKTTDGDVIEWAIGDGKKMAITLEDGTEWTVCIYCTECTAVNVYPTPEILDGLENFQTATGVEARRHLGAFHSTFSRRLQTFPTYTCSCYGPPSICENLC